MRLRRLLPAALVGTALLPAIAGGGAPGSGRTVPPTVDRAQAPRVGLPIPFEPNQGQTDPAFQYLARGRGFLLCLGEEDAAFALRDGGLLRMRLAGEETRSPFQPESRLPGVSNYFLGNDPARWRTRIPHYRSVLRKDARPGVDLRWRGDRGGIEYEAVLAAGARHRSITFELEGAESLAVDRDGALLVRTPGGMLRHSKPVAFQSGAHGDRRVPARFVLSEAGGFRIESGPCDPGLPLVVDPRVDFTTYFGGAGDDTPKRVALDGSGNVYFTGTTLSANFPTKDAYQGTRASANGDVFLSKVDPSALTLLYSTYLGGNSSETAYGLELDSSGAIYLAGETESINYPTVSPIHGNKLYTDAFLTKVSPSGDSLVYSTYIGGDSAAEGATDVAVDGTGAAYVTGTTFSTDFPTQSPFQASNRGSQDAFLCKVVPDGSSFAFSTYLGGNITDMGGRVLLDSSGGGIVLVGTTNSSNFPLQSPLQSAIGVAPDLFLAKFNSTGSALAFSTFFGGGGGDNPADAALDADGNIFVTGYTGSTGLATSSVFQGTHGGGYSDAFVAKVAGDGSAKSFFTYLGGSGFDRGFAVSVHADGQVWVAGTTESSNFPTQDSIDGALGGTRDAFLTRLTSSAGALVYSTYFGGSGVEEVGDLALDGTAFVLAGSTTSTDLSLVAPFQDLPGGASDAFLIRGSTNPNVPPGGLNVALLTVTSVRLRWNDTTTDETGFEIQRKTGSGVFGLLATVPGDAVTYDDLGLARGATYTYRVRAFNDDGASGWSGQTSVTTPPAIPGVPLNPSALAATVVSSTRIDLSWADESDNENYFKIQRRTGAGAWEDFSTPSPNVVSAVDDEVLPGRDYEYRIRAVNSSGSSDYSEPVSASTPASVDVLLEKGLIKDVEALGKDRASLRGALALNGDSPDGVFDPSTDGFEVRLGGSDGTPLAGVAAGDEGWVLKEGRHSWKPPKGSTSKVKVVVDTVEGTWTVTVQKGQFASIPENPVPVWVSVGDDAGSQSLDWRVTTGKAVVYRYP